MNRQAIIETLRDYQIQQVIKSLDKVEILDSQDRRLDIYTSNDSDEFWYCRFPNDPPAIGGGRIVAISKSTMKVVFDGYVGE